MWGDCDANHFKKSSTFSSCFLSFRFICKLRIFDPSQSRANASRFRSLRHRFFRSGMQCLRFCL